MNNFFTNLRFNQYFIFIKQNRFISINSVQNQLVPKYDYCTLESGVNPNLCEPKVVIIGAGIAGLSAANRLVNNGIKNVTILEATDRPGGRIHSKWLGDTIVEMGAHYIEGCDSNPIFGLACQEGLLTEPLIHTNLNRGLYCTSDGRTINFSICQSAYRIFKQIKKEAERIFLTESTRYQNLFDFLGFHIREKLCCFPEEQRCDAAKVMYGLVSVIKRRCGDDLTRVSPEQFRSYISIPGDDICIPFGYSCIISPLLRDLPDESVQYNKEVIKIFWDMQKPRAIIQCSDGVEISTDFIIVTIPLGVLKKQSQTLFSPLLPHSKLQAIRKLGYGVVDKVYLQYAQPHWILQEGGIKFAWSPEELTNKTDWTKGLSSVEKLEGNDNILCAWISGQEAIQMEQTAEKDIAETITQLLRKFTGDYTLPYPKTILRSKWATHPNFLGAFSYLSLKSTIEHQLNLAGPVPNAEDEIPVLLFAGEATCVGHYATVHGARISGIREADRIIKFMRKDVNNWFT